MDSFVGTCGVWLSCSHALMKNGRSLFAWMKATVFDAVACKSADGHSAPRLGEVELSHDQACLVFGRLFAVLKTKEFITDPQVISLPGASGGILRTRWSFFNERTGAQIALRVYFFVVPVRAPPGGSGRGHWLAFRIVEIRAEKV